MYKVSSKSVQGSKQIKARGAEKRNRASIDIKCPWSEGHLYISFCICNGDAMLKRFPFISWWNPANFDRWTISVGQVVPEIPLPPHWIFHWIYTDLNDHLDEPSEGRKSAHRRKNWNPVNRLAEFLWNFEPWNWQFQKSNLTSLWGMSLCQTLPNTVWFEDWEVGQTGTPTLGGS